MQLYQMSCADSKVSLHFRYLCCLTIGPTFFTAAIYFCLAHVVRFYGSVSRFSPRTYQTCFIISDVVAVLMQGGGGALSSIATDFRTLNTGIRVMIAGLSWQVASIVLFILFSIDLACRIQRVPETEKQLQLSTLPKPTRLAGLYIGKTTHQYQYFITVFADKYSC